MKTILTRLFNHEELTVEESKQILLNISREMYPEAQIAALLTVFRCAAQSVDEAVASASTYGDTNSDRLCALPPH